MREEPEVLRIPVFYPSEESLCLIIPNISKNPSAVLKITLKSHLRCSLLSSVSLCYGHLTCACVFKTALNTVSRADQENRKLYYQLIIYSYPLLMLKEQHLMFFARDL